MSAPQVEGVTLVDDSPVRAGSELRWNVELADGSPAVLGALLPELCRDEAVRRRYVGDVERLEGAWVPGVAKLLRRSDSGAPQPWRLRERPKGEALDVWLRGHAPIPVDQAADLIAKLCDTLHALHEKGVVVRDLHPRNIVLVDANPVLTDVGLARVDLLSTRTAASLVLEGSPYASPEQLRKTVLDQRSDLYGLGVLLWEALSDTRPYGDDIALLVDPSSRPALRELRPEIPAAMAACVERCIDHDPERRPDSAASVAAILRGERSLAKELPRVPCQSCGASLFQGQRLCLACGREAVTFRRSADGGRYRVVLRKVQERVDTHEELRDGLAPLASGKLPALNFIHGDQRMYSKAERKRSIQLPAILFDGLSKETAEDLRTRLTVPGVKLAVARENGFFNRATIFGLVLTGFVTAGAAFVAAEAVTMVLTIAMITGVIIFFVARHAKKKNKKKALLQLREGPAALPASDPLVTRLCTLSREGVEEDVRERLGHLALTLQRLVDHRATLPAVERKEVELVTEPIERLVGLIEREVGQLVQLDRDLEELDEGVLVRSLAAAQARGATATEREGLLDGLTRLRSLEESRARALHRLLEAGTLLARSADLGLRVSDGAAAHERDVQLALAALGETS